MSTTTKELKIICLIQVNNEGSAQGWTPSLPAGQVDNDEFEVVTDPAPIITGLTLVGTTVTAQTSAEHFFAVGQSITIANADQVEYNGTFVITAINADDTFDYEIVGAPVTPATGSITCVSSGDFLRIKSGVGYLRPKKKQVQVRWDKVGQPTSIILHDIDFQDIGVTGLRSGSFPRLEIPGGTVPSVGASDDLTIRFEVWTNSSDPDGGVNEMLAQNANNRISAQSSQLQFHNGGAGSFPATTWPNDAWSQVEIRQEDDSGYKLRIYKDGSLLLDLGATAFQWDVAQPWIIGSSIGTVDFVFANLYIEHNGVIIVNEELETGPGILNEIGTGSPTYNTLKGNA